MTKQKLLWISELTLLPAHIAALGKEVEVLHARPTNNGYTLLIESLTESQDLILGNGRYVDGVSTSHKVSLVVNKSIKDIFAEIVLPSLVTDKPFTCVSTMLKQHLKEELFGYLSGTSLSIIELTSRPVSDPITVYDRRKFTGWVEIVQPHVTQPLPSQS